MMSHCRSASSLDGQPETEDIVLQIDGPTQSWECVSGGTDQMVQPNYRAAGGSWSVGIPATWRKNATDRLTQDASCPMVRLLAFLPVRAML